MARKTTKEVTAEATENDGTELTPSEVETEEVEDVGFESDEDATGAAIMAGGAAVEVDELTEAATAEAPSVAELTVAEVVELTEEDAALRHLILEKKALISDSYATLAESLHRVYENGLAMRWGFKSFQAYLEEEVDFTYRKAQVLIGIHTWSTKFDPQQRSFLAEIGWAKARDLMYAGVDPAHFDEWKARITDGSGKVLSLAKIQEIIAALKSPSNGELPSGSSDGSGSSSSSSSSRKAMTFKLTVAQVEVVKKALAATEGGDDGEKLALICTGALASGGDQADLTGLLDGIQKSFGVKLIGLKFSGDEPTVLFGQESLDLIAPPEDGPVSSDDAEEVEEIF